MDLWFLHRAILKNPIASSIPVTGLGVTSLSLILLPECAGVSLQIEHGQEWKKRMVSGGNSGDQTFQCPVGFPVAGLGSWAFFILEGTE
jgi:hypothetical protein